jgi:sialate O-acetylesterase
MNNKQTSVFLSALFIFLLMNLCLNAKDKTVKVACIGNSVTYGYGLENREQECYPAKLQDYWAIIIMSGILATAALLY